MLWANAFWSGDHAVRAVQLLLERGIGRSAVGRPADGNSGTLDGAQAEYLLVPDAQANLAKIVDDLSDERVVLLADIASTGISAAESGDVKLGDTVAVFAQGPIGLCSTAGAK